MLILSRPDSGAYPPDTLDVELDGQHLLTISLAPIVGLRSAWFPEDRILVLGDDLAGAGVVV